MKKIFTAVFAVLLLATAVQAQLNSNNRILGRAEMKSMTRTADVRSMDLPYVPAMAAAANNNVIDRFPFYDGFEHGMSNWNIIDADGDGDVFGRTEGTDAHSGNAYAYSLSFTTYIIWSIPLTPDNWLVSNKISLPEDSTMTLSWFHRTLNVTNYAEQYSVYVATGNTVDDFLADSSNLKYVYTFAAADAAWTSPAAIDLAEYAGQDIYIAFRHNGSSGMYGMAIDDVTIKSAGQPVVDIIGKNYVYAGDTAVFNAELIEGTDVSYLWTSTNGLITGGNNGQEVHIVYSEAGYDTIYLHVSQPGGDADYVYYVTIISCEPATLPYTEDFEAGEFMCWKAVDRDTTLTRNWEVVETSMPGGNYCAAVNYSETQADNWLISRPINLASSAGHVELSFYARVLSANYPEFFEVRLSSNSDHPDDFDTILYSDTAYASTEWRRFSINLDNYTGSVYIAFRHRSTDQYMLFIDNFYVGEPLAPSIYIEAPTMAMVNSDVNIHATVVAFDPVDEESVEWDFFDGQFVAGTNITHSWDSVPTGDYNYTVYYGDNYGEDSATATIHIINCDTPIEVPYSLAFSAKDTCWTYNGWDVYSGQISYAYSAKLEGESTIEHTLSSAIYAIPQGDTNYEVEFVLANMGECNLKIEAIDVATGNSTVLREGSFNVGSMLIPFRYDLTAFAGKDVRFVLTHTGDTSTLIGLQYMYIQPLQAPVVTITVPTDGRATVNYELTAVVASATTPTYSWTIQGGTPATASTQNVTASWAAAGTYQVVLTVTNSVGSASDTAEIVIIDCTQPISQFPYTQTFENGLGCWEAYWPEEHEAYFGIIEVNLESLSSGYCFVMDPAQGDAFDRSMYLISPELNLGGQSRSVEMYVQLSNGPEAVPFEVRYSTTGNAASDFTNVARASGGNFSTLTRFNATLPAEAKYMAISYTGSGAQNFLFIDDITFLSDVQEPTGIESVGDVTVSVYPNPATKVISIKAEGLRQVELLDVNGRVVLTSTESTVNVSNLANGVYMLRTITDGGMAINKIVKE
ncbi:MAG: choice-of-anchor J domain-containing protein [Bacteroidales bacterium]|nr:choice-of-anchor J domain-containing protein [Bacteroidales bacterium]